MKKVMKEGDVSGHKVGMALGCLFLLIHFIWLLMVGFGIADWFLTWVFGLHSLSMPFTVLPLNWLNSVILLVLVFVIGYALGNLFALFWNKCSCRRG